MCAMYIVNLILLDDGIVCGRFVFHGRRIVVQFYDGGSVVMDAESPKLFDIA